MTFSAVAEHSTVFISTRPPSPRSPEQLSCFLARTDTPQRGHKRCLLGHRRCRHPLTPRILQQYTPMIFQLSLSSSGPKTKEVDQNAQSSCCALCWTSGTQTTAPCRGPRDLGCRGYVTALTAGLGPPGAQRPHPGLLAPLPEEGPGAAKRLAHDRHARRRCSWARGLVCQDPRSRHSTSSLLILAQTWSPI